VLEKFNASFINPDAYPVMDQVQQVLIARKHKAFQPDTKAHRAFLENFAEKIRVMQQKYPFLDLAEEAAYFEKSLL
jgi:hypothetical protein